MPPTPIHLVRLILFFLGIFLSHSLLGQEEFRLHVASDRDTFPRELQPDTAFPSVMKRKQVLDDLVPALWGEGYLAASLDSTAVDASKGNVLTAYLHLGRKFHWARLSYSGVPLEFLNEVPPVFRKEQGNPPVRPDQLQLLHERLLRSCENNGFPFASVYLDSLKFTGNGVSGRLNLDKGPFIVMDSIEVKGNAEVNSSVLEGYTGIRPGDPFVEKELEKVGARLKELSYLKITSPHEVIFKDEKAVLRVYLDKRQASRFNGILGIQPDENTGEIQLTGDVELALQNALKHGESIQLNWERLRPQTQELEIGLDIPFLFHTHFGVDGRLNLYKEDTLFTQVERKGAVKYLLKGGDYFKVFVHYNTSEVLSDDAVIRRGRTMMDLSRVLYGVGFDRAQYDNRFNPVEGYGITLDAGIGKKRVNPPEGETLPEGMEEVSTQYDLQGEADLFIPLLPRTTFKIGLQGGYVYASSSAIFENEMFRIGGMGSLRGFDQTSIYTSGYGILTGEFRYILEERSNLYAFFDGAFYERNSVDELVSDTPFGFGVGTSFETRAGIFSISYALGKQFDNPILFRAAKVHFGFVNFF